MRGAGDAAPIVRALTVPAALGHGLFGAWLESEFGWNQKTAERFMQVTDRFKNRQIVEIAPSALYLLASNSTPEDVRIEFTDLAAAGQRGQNAEKCG